MIALSVPELLEGVYGTRNGPNPTPLGIGVSTRVSSADFPVQLHWEADFAAASPH